MNGLLIDIRDLILAARKAVVRSVDLIQVLTNFEIGRRIVEHEQMGKHRAEYGESTLKLLAQALTTEFGKGFSLTNLKIMRKFYLTYQTAISQTEFDLLPWFEKSQTASDFLQKSPIAFRQAIDEGKTLPISSGFSLSWSHYVFLVGIKDPSERRFYEIEATDQG